MRLLLAGSALAIAPPAALADFKNYIGASGAPNNQWLVDQNWSPTGAPLNGDDVTIGNFPDTTFGPVMVDFDDNYAGTGLHTLIIDNTGVFGTNPRVFLDQSADSAMIAGTETIGLNRYGNYSQSAGNNTAGTLNVGFGGPSPIGIGSITNTYQLSGTGTLTVTGDELIGVHSGGGGDFTQTGGTHTIVGNLIVGQDAGSAGTFTLFQGTLSAANETIGLHGIGQVHQGTTMNMIAGTLTVGGDANSGNQSTYSLAGQAKLSAKTELVHGTFSQNGGTHTVAGTLTVEGFMGQTSGGEFDLVQGALTANNVVVGDTSIGTFSQALGTGGSTLTLSQVNGSGGTLTLGNSAGGAGIFGIAGSGSVNSLSAFDEIVGNQGLGAMEQDGGSNTFTHRLVIASQSGSTGAFTLTGGTLTGGRLVVGFGGAGTYLQTGGALFANDGVGMGTNAGSKGQLTLSGGNATSPSMIVALAGSATVDHSAGNLVVHGADSDGLSGMTIGFSTGSSGTYNLSATGALSTDATYVGNDGAGTFNQTGGSHTTGALYLGRGIGSGAYTLSGSAGALMVSGFESVGYIGTGTFTQSDGVHTIGGDLQVGSGPASSGTYKMTGGTVTVAGNVGVGHEGTGTFDHSNGTVNLKGGLYVGSIAGGHGTYHLSGPSSVLTATGVELVGAIGTGLFTQDDGSNTISELTAFSGLYIGDSSTGSGQYLLNHGTLATSNTVVGNDGTGSFTQTGGQQTLTRSFTLGLQHGTGTGVISGGTLSVGQDINIGYRSPGTATFSGTAVITSVNGLIAALPSSTGSLTLGPGGGTWTLSGSLYVGGNPISSGGNGTLNVDTGSTLTVGGTLKLWPGGTVNVNGGSITAASIVNDPGTFNFNSGSITITGDDLHVGSAGPIGAAITLDSSKHLTVNHNLVIDPDGALTVGGGTLAAGKLVNQGTLAITDGTLALTHNSTPVISTTGPFSLTGGGRFDLSNNGLAIGYAGGASPVPSVRAALVSGYHGGAWDGPGLDSSDAKNSPYALGYADSADGAVAGLDDNTVLVKFTRSGDANLDGQVNFSDLLSLAQHYGSSSASWDQGDFNYDGSVNFTDLLLLAQNYGMPSDAAGAGVSAALPEPVSLAPSAPLFLLLRRRPGARKRFDGSVSTVG